MQELPSENAQHLAAYLREHDHEFATVTIYEVVMIDIDKLAQTIQNYWDSLL